MDYHEFCLLQTRHLTAEEKSSEEETSATPQEIQWRKGYDNLMAIRHNRS
jgi:hypothetical protein